MEYIQLISQSFADLIFVAGLVVISLSAITFVKAYVTAKSAALAVTQLLFGAGVLAFCHWQYPDHYSFSEIPHLVSRVVSQIV